MARSLKLYYAGCLKELVGETHGISREDLSSMQERLREAQQSLQAKRQSGQLGFYDLPYDKSQADQALKLAKAFQKKCDTFVLIGIGGSALGPLALKSALLPAFWDLLSDKERRGKARCFMADNVDPVLLAGLLRVIDPKKTVFNIVSKSGTTSESLANYFVLRSALVKKVGAKNYSQHVVVTTDPEKGFLREMAVKENLPCLSIPPNVGGRFSVLTPVGLLPAAFMGIAIQDLLRGAAAMESACRTEELLENPAAVYAAIQYLFYWKNRPISVMFPYSQSLQFVADWYCQLWAESLGKEQDLKGAKINVGPTPVRALGVTDQHSQVQLYMEGPHDKIITFLSVEDFGTDIPIPRYNSHPLGGSSLKKLLKAEEQATRLALTKNGRPHCTIRIPKLTASAIGELLMLLECAVAYAGELFGIDAFNQPGVELGKKLTKALMNEPGFETARAEIEDLTRLEQECSAVV